MITGNAESTTRSLYDRIVRILSKPSLTTDCQVFGRRLYHSTPPSFNNLEPAPRSLRLAQVRMSQVTKQALVTSKIRWVLPLLIMLVAGLDFSDQQSLTKPMPRIFLNESIQLSAATYATCRLINGGVSSLQESSISISRGVLALNMKPVRFLIPSMTRPNAYQIFALNRWRYLACSGSC